MATSGSKDFSITRSELIAAALRKCGVYDHGEPIPAEEEQDAAFALNVLVKEWSARGIDIWLRQELTVFINGGGQQSYEIGHGSIAATPEDHATISEPIVSKLTADAPTTGGVVNISVEDTTGMGGSVNTGALGIKLDDNTLHWTSITSVVDSTTLTILDGPTTAASSGKAVYNYRYNQDAGLAVEEPKPQKFLYAMRRNNDGLDVPVDIIGEKEYQALSLKSQEGQTTQVWYKPGRTTGELHVWPTGGNNGGFDRLVIQAQFHPDDMDAVSNEPEFPIEWANALIFHLAHDLCPEYGVDRQTRADLYAIAERKLNEQLDYDVENASVRFTLDQRVQSVR
jgi:hypothetical protein